MKSLHIQGQEKEACIWALTSDCVEDLQDLLAEIPPHMMRGLGFEVWNPLNAQHCADFIEELEVMPETFYTWTHLLLSQSSPWRVTMATENCGGNAGRRIYWIFSRRGRILQWRWYNVTRCLSQSHSRTDGERGNTDSDGRITARGRDHFRKLSFALRREDPYEQATPHPSPAIIIDLTGDDSNFFYDVWLYWVTRIFKQFWRVIQSYWNFLKAGLQIRYNCALVGCPAPTHNPELQGRNDMQEEKIDYQN